MQILFKLDNPTFADPTVAHSGVKSYIAQANRNMAWETIEPFFNPAARDYLIPHIGRDFYDTIAAKFHADTIAGAEVEALELMQRTVAHGMALDFALAMNVQLTDMGPQESSDKEGTSNGPSQWKFATTNWHTIRKMDRSLDELLLYLDQQIKADDTLFLDYQSSSIYQKEGSDFFRTVEEMEEYLNIEGSRRAFNRITKYFRKAERRYILPILGQDFYDELKTAYRDGTLTEPQEEAVVFVQRCAAEFGAYEAIPHISAVWQSDSIVIVSKTDGFNSRAISNTLFGQAMIERVRQHTQEDGERERLELKTFLIQNADDYPTYKNSSAFPTEDTNGDIYGGEEAGAVLL